MLNYIWTGIQVGRSYLTIDGDMHKCSLDVSLGQLKVWFYIHPLVDKGGDEIKMAPGNSLSAWVNYSKPVKA